jgi:hypothetical protein
VKPSVKRVGPPKLAPQMRHRSFMKTRLPDVSAARAGPEAPGNDSAANRASFWTCRHNFVLTGFLNAPAIDFDTVYDEAKGHAEAVSSP